MDEQKIYYVQNLESKNPLENMRGIVTLPQPAQWKVHALKQWLAERPLKPDDRDMKFLQASIKQCTDALSDAVMKDPSLTQHSVGKRTASMMIAGGELSSAIGEGAVTQSAVSLVGTSMSPLMQVLAKQDAILGAVKKQNQQQSILNKITILTQSIMGYNQEISILRSTHNDIENRILTVEMKIAELPSAEEGLKKIIEKHEERKAGVDSKIKVLEEKIASVRADIDTQNEGLKNIDEDDDEEEATAEVEIEPPAAKKAKEEEQEYELEEQQVDDDNNYHQGVVVHQEEHAEV